MDLSRTFDELEKHKNLINQREEKIEELVEELNNSKEEEKAIAEEYKMMDINKNNKIEILKMEIKEEKNKKFENKEEKENSKEKIENNKKQIIKIEEDFQKYEKENFEIKKDNLSEKLDNIKKDIKAEIGLFENVKEVFKKYYEELMEYPEIKKMYDKAVADRAEEKANELANVNEIYKNVVSEYYKNIELKRGKISLKDKKKFEIELENGIEKEELKELTLEIIEDVSKRDKKDLTKNEMRLKENLEKEYKDVHITDDIRDEIFSKNETLIDAIRRETLEEKVKLYEYENYNQMIDLESKSKKKLYSKEEFQIAKEKQILYSKEDFQIAKEKQKEAIEFAIDINDEKINEYAEKMLHDGSFITGVLRYSKMNENSDVKNYLENKETIKNNKKEIIKTILKDYGDTKVKTNMGKEEHRFRDVAEKINDIVTEKVKDKVDMQKNEEEHDKETLEENKNFENEKNKRNLPNTPRSAVKSSNEYMNTLTIEELRETQKEKVKKKGFISGIKNWIANRKKQKEMKDIEEKENLEDTVIFNKNVDNTEEKANKEKKIEKELSKKDKEELKNYEDKFREFFREMIENDERIKEQTIKNSKEEIEEEKEK